MINKRANTMHKRLIYLAVAIIASAVLFLKPVFSFQDDSGIKYVRHFSMTNTDFVETLTPFDTTTHASIVKMPVRGLLYCNILMLCGSILCLLSFFDEQKQIWICIITSVFVGAYYVMMIWYAIRISDVFFATLYPNYMAILPIVVLQMMLMTRREIVHEMLLTANDNDETEEIED